MGLFDKIGGFVSKAFNAVQSGAKAVGNVAGKVADVAKGATSIGQKILNFVSKPMSEVLAPVKEKVGGFLDKLPFGLGNMLKPLAEKAFDKAASWLSGPANAVAAFIGKALPTVQKVADFAEQLRAVSDKVGGLQNPIAQSNFQNQMAYAHAQHVA
jgi:phage-related protein